MSRSLSSRRWRLVAAAPAVGLIVAGAVTGGGAGVSSAAGHPVATSSDLGESYINYAAPNSQRQIGKGEKVNKKILTRAEQIERKNAGGNPRAARQLAKIEAKAIRTGQNPRQIKQAKGTQKARLLTLLVQFGGHDDFSGFSRPKTVFGERTCVTEPAGTVFSGPLHNSIPNPASYSHLDNNSMWVPDFDNAHYNKMLYTSTGITDRVRTDLTGPDGQPGFDISGYTMSNMYKEMSKGAYDVTGEAVGWLTVPHSEAYYAASDCRSADSDFPQSMDGHPSNPRGPAQLGIDAVNVLAAQQPNFPWADYDVEDQGDVDGDGNVNEPDGVVDHLVLIHAGEDKSGGGGAEGTYAIWAHSSDITGGYTVPGTSVKVSNYILQPEDSGVGVFAHEYGHDLGLPDLYDTSGEADSDIDFWDLMNTGSHSGPIFQSMPAHMGLWDKWVLGWADPKTFTPGQAARAVQLGQSSNTPRGTEDGIKVNLPPKVVTLATPHSGAAMWWSNNDQNWADARLSRPVAVPAGATDARFWMWNNYVAEDRWDYGFVEASTDGGTTWSQLVVKDAAGATVSTNDDPNGRLVDYGGLHNGLTGSSDGWRHDYVDLTPYAGTTVQVRLRYATDAGFVERGWFADDFSVTNGAATVWSDDVESGLAGWTATPGTFTDTSGAGWVIDSGTSSRSQYYLAEWRNFDGFDKGLQYAYDTTYSSNGPWKVEKIRYNAPGMLVWYRDTTYGSSNAVTADLTGLPSVGSKGGLLLVDSHFDPLRRTGVAAVKDTSTLDNLPSRPQSSNAAFSTHATYPFRECLGEVPKDPDQFAEYCTDFGPQAGVTKFTDAKGWYPGIEIRGSSLFLKDIDGGVVLPNGDNERYSVRVTDQNGNPLPQFYGVDVSGAFGAAPGTAVLGDGNPTKPYGVTLEIKNVAKDNSYATIWVHPAN